MAQKPKWEQEWERLKEDPSIWESLSKAIKKSLINRGYATEAGELIEQEAPVGWYIEYWARHGKDEGWFKQFSPIGERLTFNTQEDAEKKARELSLQNMRLFRVMQFGIAPSFIVYDYGQRYVEDGLTHVRTKMESTPFDAPDNDLETDVYRLQSRTAFTGRPTEWGKSDPAVYLEISEAAQAALSLSKADAKKEFRVVAGDMALSPEPAAIYRRGDRLPNVDLLADLVALSVARTTSEALVSLLVLWKGPDEARTLVQQMHEVTS